MSTPETHPRRPRRLLAAAAAAVLAATTLVPSTAFAQQAAPTFTDVDYDSVHGDAIDHAAGEGIVVGYSDGDFEPARAVTRGQLASILVRTFDLEPVTPARFADARGTTHEGAIEAAAAAGIISGYADGTFRPGEPIRRDHLASMIARHLDVDASDDGSFEDLDGNRYEGQINALDDLGIMRGRSATTFDPAGNLRRDQTASVVSRLLRHLGSQQAEFTLTLLHANDGESALIPDTTTGEGGVARFVAQLQDLQDAAPAGADAGVLTISSGDNFLAGPQLAASEADGVFYDARVYVEAGFDAMTIGNHDFDFGPDRLVEFIEAIPDVPFLSANLDFSDEPGLAALEAEGRLAGSAVFEVAGRDVGIVGATTEQLRSISSPRNVEVSAVLAAVQAEVDALLADGVEIIVLSSHLQDLDEELTLVPRLTGVDAVIGGGGGEALGPRYPRFARDADGNRVPVVTTPGAYADIGHLVLHFDADGDLLAAGLDSALLPVDPTGPRNQTIVDTVEAPVAEHVAELAANIVATTEVPLDGRRQEPGVRDRETNLGNILTDGLLATARLYADEYGVPEADVALQNGGGMRIEAIIQPGNVTELDTYRIASFANFISVAQVSGDQLRSALERSVSAQPGAGGFHGQWAGIQFTFDTSRQAQTVDFLAEEITTQGERIVDAVVTRADGTEVVLVEDGETVAGAEVFSMATISFLFGGDGYFALEDVENVQLPFTYQQGLLAQFEAIGTVTSANYPDLSVDADTYTRFGPIGEFAIG
ncbi:MAG: 5'-nucleotidase C-terminal domain-containing protein [Actinobacteria bacterium]|nr:5'-nucleotidase C-terminal domain-containing protein [Actinomycetota bacterium]